MSPKGIILTTLGIGTLGAIGVSSFWLSHANNIRDFLLLEGKRPLDTEGIKNNEQWKILIEKHRETAVSIDGKQIDKLSIDISQDEAEEINKLKQECKKLLKEPVSKNNDEFQTKKNNTINWCTLDSKLIPEANRVSLSLGQKQ